VTQQSAHTDAQHAVCFSGKVLLALAFGLLLMWASFVISSRITGPKILAWISLGPAFVVLAYSTEQWVKIVTGLLFLGALNAAVAAGLGYLPTNRNVQMHTGEAIAAAFVLAIAATECLVLYHRHHGSLDRAALLLYVLCVLWAMALNSLTLPLVVGAFVLIVPTCLRHLPGFSGKF
jgi:hypothetical protein